MRPPLAVAIIALAAALAGPPPTPSHARSCRRNGAHDCFKLPARLDFSAVPDISDRIVVGEPALQAPKAAPIDRQPTTKPYTGPMFGVESHSGAPTVGYYWSLH